MVDHILGELRVRVLELVERRDHRVISVDHQGLLDLKVGPKVLTCKGHGVSDTSGSFIKNNKGGEGIVGEAFGFNF